MAFGIEALYMSYAKKKKINVGTDVDAKLEGDDIGYGFDIALHYKPCKYARLGLVYRSKIDLKIEGEASFDDVPAIFSASFPETRAWGELTLPDMWAFGLAIYPADKLSVELGATRTGWSSYEEMVINYDEPVTPFAKTQTTEKKNWKDTWRLNVGVEYAATDWLDLRLGYVYDESPVPDNTIDYMVPSNDRHIFGAGTGFKWDSWTLDLAYNYLMILDRDIKDSDASNVQDGSIDNGQAHMFSMSLGYKF